MPNLIQSSSGRSSNPGKAHVVLSAKPPGRRIAIPQTPQRQPRPPGRGLVTRKPQDDDFVIKTPVEVLDERYKMFKDQRDIYDTIGQMYASVGHILTSSDEARDAGASYSDFRDPKMVGINMRKAEVQPNNHLKIVKDGAAKYVETYINLEPISMRVAVGPDRNTSKIERLVRGILPNFSVPEDYSTEYRARNSKTGAVEPITKNQYDNKEPLPTGLINGHSVVLPKIQDQKMLWPLPKLAQVNFRYADSDPEWPESMHLPRLSKSYISHGFIKFPMLSNIEFSVAQKDAEITAGPLSYAHDVSGKLSDQNAGTNFVTIKIQARVVMHWPLEFAMYVTSAAKLSDFIPYLFHNYVHRHALGYATSTDGGKRSRGAVRPPAKVNHLGVVKQAIAEEGPKNFISVNEDGFLILGIAEENYAGSILYVSPVDAVDEYVNQIKQAYDPETETVNKPPDRMKDRGLFLDPNNNKFSFINREGNIETYDLNGSIAVDDITIGRWLDSPLSAFLKTMEILDHVVDFDADFYARYEQQSQGQISRHTSILGTANTLSTKSRITLKLHHLGGGQVETVEGNVLPLETMQCQMINEAAAIVLKNIDALDVAYSVKILNTRFILTAITKYAKDYSQYMKKRAIAIARNAAIGIDENKTDYDTYNLPGLTFNLPHQMKIYNRTATFPANVVLGVDAGGGKCLEDVATVVTAEGVLTLGELWDSSDEHISPEGFRARQTKIATRSGTAMIANTYRTRGRHLEVRFSDASIVKGLPEHKLYAYDVETDTHDFVPIGEMKTGKHFVSKAVGTRLFSNKLATWDYSDADAPNIIRFPQRMSLRFARQLGWLVAEGYNRADRMTFFNKDVEVVRSYCADMEVLFGVHPAVVEDDCNGVYAVTPDPAVRRFLKTHIRGERSAEMDVPFAVRTSPEAVQCEFLRALFDGDGSIYREEKIPRWTIELTTISRDLYLQTRTMLENIGIYCEGKLFSTWTNNGSAKQVRKPGFALFIAPASFELFAEKVGFGLDYKVERLQECLEHQRRVRRDPAGNFWTQNLTNWAPCGRLLRELETRLTSVLSTFEYETQAGRNVKKNICNLNWFWRYAGFGEGAVRTRQKPIKDFMSKYRVRETIKAIDALPPDMREIVQNEVGDLIPKLKYMLDRVWTRPVRFIKRRVMEYAYDLTVPGPHEYVTCGFYGHNTGIGIQEMARMMAMDKIRRPLVICPQKLVRTWVQEINNFSKGMINPFVLDARTTRRITKVLNRLSKRPTAPDYARLKAIIAKFPKNTILITSSSFLGTVNKKDILYGDKVFSRYPNAEFFREIGVDYIILDESQEAKNLGSNRTSAISVAMTDVPYKRIASGTILNNTAIDYVGQMALFNPSIFATEKAFKENFMDADQRYKLMRPGAASQISQVLKPYVQRFNVKRRDWAYALPKLDINIYGLKLTPNQQAFYNSQVDEKVGELMADPKIMTMLTDNDPEMKEKIATALRTYFAKIEEFLCAPDDNEAFINQSDVKLQPEDMVSPKVGAVVKILNQHFNVKKDHNKVIVFAYRTATPAHIFRHLPENWRKMAILYTPKIGLQALHQFERDPNIKVLIASEMSINKGQNLQMASRLIRCETLWAPGDQDQAISRIWRPDLDSSGNARFSRDSINLDYLYVDSTLEVAKLARMIAKIVDKVKVDEDENPNFNEMKERLGRLPLITMNLETIRKNSEFFGIPDFVQAWSDLREWEDGEFKRIAETTKVKLVGITPEHRKVMEGGGRLTYVPRVDGADPVLTGFKSLKPISVIETDMINAARKASDDESDDEVEVEVNPYRIGQLVDTEWGLGYIAPGRTKQDEVDVKVPGWPDVVTVSKASCYVFGDPEEEARAALLLKKAGKTGLPRRPGDVLYGDKMLPGKVEVEPKTTRQVGVEPETPEEEEDEFIEVPTKTRPQVDIKRQPPKPVKVGVRPVVTPPKPRTPVAPTDRTTTKPPPKVQPQQRVPKVRDFVEVKQQEDIEQPPLELKVEIIDGALGLTAFLDNPDEEAAYKDLLRKRGWRYVGKVYVGQVKTAAGIDNLWEFLRSKRYVVPQKYKDNFEPLKLALRQKSLEKMRTSDFASIDRFMQMMGQRKPNNPQELRPYPMIVDGQLFIVFNAITTPKAAVVMRAELSGMKKFTLDGPYASLLEKSKAEAITEVRVLSKQANVADPADVIDSIKSIQITRR